MVDTLPSQNASLTESITTFPNYHCNHFFYYNNNNNNNLYTHRHTNRREYQSMTTATTDASSSLLSSLVRSVSATAAITTSFVGSYHSECCLLLILPWYWLRLSHYYINIVKVLTWMRMIISDDSVPSVREFLPASTMFVPPGCPTCVVARSMTSDAVLYFHEDARLLPINALRKNPSMNNVGWTLFSVCWLIPNFLMSFDYNRRGIRSTERFAGRGGNTICVWTRAWTLEWTQGSIRRWWTDSLDPRYDPRMDSR